MDLINITGDEVLALPTLIGKPVIVLSALQPMKEKSELADDANQKRKDITRLYPSSRQVWVDSGHGIPTESPAAVIEAIQQQIVRSYGTHVFCFSILSANRGYSTTSIRARRSRLY